MIRVLPESIANKIAAGEVVERPASVIKELVENALDAGATSIEIDIRHGGKSVIRVSDNGCGMSREDAAIACARHATSKIASAEDLLRVASFGFRGEALPSIAAVSRLTLSTGLAGGATGTELRIEGGRQVSLRDAAPRHGTTVDVADLFFNTPARRKFLRTDSTELGHGLDLVSSLALARLDVRWLLRASGRTVLDVIPITEPLERARAILGEAIARELLPLDGSSDGVRVHGLIGKPAIARANRTGQRWFVNGRCVRAPSLAYALLEGYLGLLMHGQFPVAVVFLELDPQRIDVNVHPTKQEVRISNEPAVKALIRGAIAASLRAAPDLAPSLPPVRPRARPVVARAAVGTGTAQRVFTLNEPPRVYTTSPTTQVDTPVSVRDTLKITRVLGQLHQMFLVAETEEGFILVDQHAAHERVMFETLRTQWRAGHPEQQTLLIDELLEVHPRQLELLNNRLPVLRRLGFDIEPFGERAFAVHSYPAALGNPNLGTLLHQFLDDQEEGRTISGLETHEQEVAALIACTRRSVKAHEPLPPEAARTLLTRLAQCEHPFNCPHGRPTLLTHSLPDLERYFKRT